MKQSVGLSKVIVFCHFEDEKTVRSIRAVLEGMTEWVWNLEREMKGWELEGRPDLLVRSKRKMNRVSLSSLHHLRRSRCQEKEGN